MRVYGRGGEASQAHKGAWRQRLVLGLAGMLACVGAVVPAPALAGFTVVADPPKPQAPTWTARKGAVVRATLETWLPEDWTLDWTSTTQPRGGALVVQGQFLDAVKKLFEAQDQWRDPAGTAGAPTPLVVRVYLKDKALVVGDAGPGAGSAGVALEAEARYAPASAGPAPIPASEPYEARAGEMLGAVLRRWAAQYPGQNHQVVWESTWDYRLDASASFGVDFQTAIAAITQVVAISNPTLKIRLYRNGVVVVTDSRK